MAVWPSMGGRKRLVAILIVFILIVGLVFLLSGSQGVAVTLFPMLFSFVAGVVASVSPCGILMLPTYMFFHLGGDEESPSRASRALGALLTAGVTVSGLMITFLVAGSLVGLGSQWLATSSSYTGIFLGAAMVGLGIWLLVTRRTLGIMAAQRVITPQRSLTNALLFGIAYALGSLSCGLPLFLGVAGSALASGGMPQAIGQFLAYALGMGSIIIGVSVGSVLFRESMDRWLQLLSRYAYRMNAVFLIVIGVYSIIYRIALLLAAPGAG